MSSCRVTVGKPAQPATGADPAPAADAKPADAKPGSGARRANPESTDPGRGGMWGHVVMPRPDKSIEKLGQRLAPPMFAPMVSVAQFKSMLAMRFEERGDVVDHIDLSKPLGCAVANPKAFEPPIVCAIGYQGGLPQLVKDLGQQGYKSGGDGYAAYELSGEDVYMQAMGDHVAFAMEPSLLAAASGYLQQETLRVDAKTPDFYGLAWPSRIFADARPEVNEFLDGMESALQNSDASVEDYSAASGKAAREMYESFGDLKTVEGSLNIGKQRTKAVYRATANEGTKTHEQYQSAKSLGLVDVGLLEAMPDDAFFVVAMNFDPKHFTDDPWMSSYLSAMQGIKTAEGEPLGAVMTTLFETWSDVMAGPIAMSAFPVGKSPGAIGASYALQPGADAKAMMRKFVTDYPAEKMVPAYAEYVKSSYKNDAFSVGGVKADTYTFSASKKALSQLKSSSKYAKLKKALGGKVQITMAFAQKKDHLYLVMTTTNAKAAMGRMLGAAKGKGNLGKFGSAKKLLRKHGTGSSLFMLDVAGMLAWVKALGFADDPASIPAVGGALDDVVVTGRMTKRGKREYAYSMSQGLIDQLRNL